jgi:hypothetical protein
LLIELNPLNKSLGVVCAVGCCEGADAIIVILVISRTLACKLIIMNYPE